MITKGNAVYKEEVTLSKSKNGYELTVTETFINQDHYGQDSEETISKTYAVIGWEVAGSCEPDYVEIDFHLEDEEEVNSHVSVVLELKDLIGLINK